MQAGTGTIESAPLTRTPALSGLIWLAAESAPIVLLFMLLERSLMKLCRLPVESYEGPVIAVGLVRAVTAHPYAFQILLSIGLLTAFRHRLLWRVWGELDHGPALRVFVGGLVLIFAWTFASYDTNLYFDRSHSLDRALLLVFAALVLWRPAFLLLFLPLLMAVVWQFEHPLGGYSWTDKSAPVRALLLFQAAFLWLSVTGRRSTEAFLFTVCCLVAAHYWIPGLEKLRLGWLAHGSLHHLTVAAWENGWLAGSTSAEIASFARGLAQGEIASLGFTIAIEAGALLFLLHRGVALVLLGGWVLLHAGIFATSGICFWKWVLMDVGLALLLLRLSPSAQARIFGPGPCLVSLVLIAGAPHWCAPVRLGWYDTRLAYTYRYTLLGPSGTEYRAAPAFFAPYDIPFSQNRFGYLSDRPSLVGTYGMTLDARIAQALIDVRTLEEVEVLEDTLGKRQVDARQGERFDDFMHRFLGAWNRHGGRRPWYAQLRPPLHIWTAPHEPAYAGQEPVARLLVDRVTTLWDGERLQEVRVERVRDLEIEHPASFPARREVAGREGVRADRAVEQREHGGEQGADGDREQADQHVARVAAAREAHPGDQRGLQVAVAALDSAAREIAQQVAQAVLGEAVVVVGRFVDLEDEGRAQHEQAAGGEHAPDLGERERRVVDVLEHLHQEDRVEASRLEDVQVADVRHDVRAPRGIDVEGRDAALAHAPDALRELSAAADAEHPPRAGALLERGDLAVEPLVQVLPGEAVRRVEYELPVAQSGHGAPDASARGSDHAGSPQSAGMLALRRR
jgi:hypothetical protein